MDCTFASVGADRDINETAFCHLMLVFRLGLASRPDVDLYGHRAAAFLQQTRMQFNQVSNAKRRKKLKLLNCRRCDASPRSGDGDRRASDIGLGKQPPAEYITIRVSVCGHGKNPKRELPMLEIVDAS